VHWPALLVAPPESIFQQGHLFLRNGSLPGMLLGALILQNHAGLEIAGLEAAPCLPL